MYSIFRKQLLFLNSLQMALSNQVYIHFSLVFMLMWKCLLEPPKSFVKVYKPFFKYIYPI